MIYLSASVDDVQRLASSNELNFNNTLLTALTELGVPAVGIMALRGVDSGQLRSWRDPVNRRWCWEWLADGESAPGAAARPIQQFRHRIFDVLMS